MNCDCKSAAAPPSPVSRNATWTGFQVKDTSSRAIPGVPVIYCQAEMSVLGPWQALSCCQKQARFGMVHSADGSR